MELNTWSKISDHDYHNLDLISFHGLMQCMKSYNHYLDSLANRVETPAMRFGTLAHMMALEPLKFKDLVRMAPSFDRRTTKGKADYEAFNRLNEGLPLIYISQDDYDRLKGMRAKLDELMDNPELSWIFSRAVRIEEALTFELYKDPYVIAKMKPDIVGDNFILDYKTTQDAWLWGFEKISRRYYYDLQLYFYQMGDFKVSGENKNLFILAQESESPYEFQLYRLPKHGANEVHEMIDVAFEKYLLGINGTQPGYPRKVLDLNIQRGF